MSTRKRFALLSGAAAIMAVLLWAAIPVSTVFEIDGNTVDPSLGLPDDWNTLNGDCTKPAGGSGSPGGSNTRTCIGSENPPKIFTQGGSKDFNDISDWSWKQADTVPDKDTLTHAYAASYQSAATSDHKIIVIGGDRFATNGDAQIGAWLFQNDIKTLGATKGGFDGVHKKGDVLLLSNFTNGGGSANIAIFEWDPACNPANKLPAGCADANLRALSSNGAAITNSSVLPAADVTWDYGSKFGLGTKDDFPIGSFFEAGADLTAAFGGEQVPCFASFLMETRSSQETSAVLKDFVLGSFPECKITVTKNCACATVDGNTGVYTFNYGGTVQNLGGATVYHATVVDTLPDSTTVSYDCGTLNAFKTAGDTKNWPAQCNPTTPTTFTTKSPPPTNMASGVACTTSTDVPPSGKSCTVLSDPKTVSKECAYDATGTPGCFTNPAIDIVKSCSTKIVQRNGAVEVRVDFKGTVTNTVGTEALINVVVTEDDNNDGSIDNPNVPLVGCSSGNGTPASPCTLNIGASATFSGSYFPNSFLDVDTGGLGRAKFFDKVVSTGTGKVSGKPVTANFTANCVVCPAGACLP